MRPYLKACLQFLAAHYKRDMNLLEKGSHKGHEDEGTAASLLKVVAERAVSENPEEKAQGVLLTYTIPLRTVQIGRGQAHFSSAE